MNPLYAFSSALFAAIFLVSVMIFGETLARNIAIAAALLACASQFMAQDPKSYAPSIYSAYAAFVAALLSYVALLTGI
jgi:hypothetical protein